MSSSVEFDILDWLYDNCLTILGILSFAIVNHSLLHILAKYNESIPPGRKMVKTEILNLIFRKFYQIHLNRWPQTLTHTASTVSTSQTSSSISEYSWRLCLDHWTSGQLLFWSSSPKFLFTSPSPSSTYQHLFKSPSSSTMSGSSNGRIRLLFVERRQF